MGPAKTIEQQAMPWPEASAYEDLLRRPRPRRTGLREWLMYDRGGNIVRLYRSARPRGSRRDDVAARFKRLSERWREETRFSPTMKSITTHPDYLRIIGMGTDVLPLILYELRSAQPPEHWFTALAVVAGEDPAREETTVESAQQAWLRWADAQGF